MKSRMNSSEGRSFHTGGVTGSIPVAPTIHHSATVLKRGQPRGRLTIRTRL